MNETLITLLRNGEHLSVKQIVKELYESLGDFEGNLFTGINISEIESLINDVEIERISEISENLQNYATNYMEHCSIIHDARSRAVLFSICVMADLARARKCAWTIERHSIVVSCIAILSINLNFNESLRLYYYVFGKECLALDE